MFLDVLECIKLGSFGKNKLKKYFEWNQILFFLTNEFYPEYNISLDEFPSICLNHWPRLSNIKRSYIRLFCSVSMRGECIRWTQQSFIEVGLVAR